MNILIPLLTISSLVTGNCCHLRQLSSNAPESVIIASNTPFSTSSSSPSTSAMIESCDCLDPSRLDKPTYFTHFLSPSTVAASITSAQPIGNVTIKATMTNLTTTTQSNSNSGLVFSLTLSGGLSSSSVIYPNFTISSSAVASNSQSSASLSPTDNIQPNSSLSPTSSTPLSSSAAWSSTGSFNHLSLTNSGQSTSALSSISIIAPLSSQVETPTKSSNPTTLTSILQTSSVLQNPVFTQLTVVVPAVTTTVTTSVSIATQTPDITSASSGSSLLNAPNKLVPIVVGVVVGAAALVGLFEV
jgi:hypothetical protein